MLKYVCEHRRIFGAAFLLPCTSVLCAGADSRVIIKNCRCRTDAPGICGQRISPSLSAILVTPVLRIRYTLLLRECNPKKKYFHNVPEFGRKINNCRWWKGKNSQSGRAESVFPTPFCKWKKFSLCKIIMMMAQNHINAAVKSRINAQAIHRVGIKIFSGIIQSCKVLMTFMLRALRLNFYRFPSQRAITMSPMWTSVLKRKIQLQGVLKDSNPFH